MMRAFSSSYLKQIILFYVLLALVSSTKCSPSTKQSRQNANTLLTRITNLFKVDTSVSPSDVTFYFYNREQDGGIPLNLGTFNGSIPTFVNSTLPNYFLSHGSGDSYRGLLSMKTIILDQQDANVFLIDWSHHAAMFYTIVVTCVPKLTSIMGEAVDKYLQTQNISPNNVNLIGHSLGSHVVGGIGAHLQGKANFIVGLDPAGPLFQNESPEKRLDRSDALYVQVLHTNGGFQGMIKSVGHADFYPNGGGMNQPGCGSDLFGSCAHARATAIFRKSLKTGGFKGRKCESFEDFKAGKCSENDIAEFGTISIDKTAEGRFYLETNAKSPYATGKC